MSDLQRFIETRSQKSPVFKAEYEAEMLRIELVRAREASGLTQRDLAERLGVSQPRIAQVERGTRPMSATFMLRYAAAVNARLQVVSR